MPCAEDPKEGQVIHVLVGSALGAVHSIGCKGFALERRLAGKCDSISDVLATKPIADL